MSDQYDVIVIGAGNGGLSAAAFAAKSGLKTLLIERHNLPGGCATSFKRGRFEFEAALHELGGYSSNENDGNIRKFFDELGLNTDLYEIDDCFTVFSPGPTPYVATMPNGRENFISAMESCCPGSTESVTKFFELADECSAGVTYLMENEGVPDRSVLESKYPVFMQLAYQSVDDVLNALQMPETAQDILKTYWTYICIPTDEYEFPLYATMVQEYVDNHAFLPRNRSNGLSLAFDQRIRDFGGDIWYNTPADEIITKNGKAFGVRIGDRIIGAKKIIADLNPNYVYGSLIQAEDVPEQALKLANARELGITAITVYYGLNKTAEELGIHEYSRFINRGKSPEAFESFKHFNPKMIGGVMNCPNVAIPDYSPEGTCIVWGTTLLRPESWDDIELKDYHRIKETVSIAFAQFYKMTAGIDILDSIEEVEVATPVTFARYLNTPDGTIYGYQGRKWDNMIPRMLTYKQENYLDNLIFCGGHGFRMDGYSSAYETGQAASRIAIEEIKEGR